MLRLNEHLLRIARERSIDVLIATAHPDNVSSCKSLEKLGMAIKGSMVKSGRFPRNIYLMMINES